MVGKDGSKQQAWQLEQEPGNAHTTERVNWEWWEDVGPNGLQQSSSANDGLTKMTDGH